MAAAVVEQSVVVGRDSEGSSFAHIRRRQILYVPSEEEDRCSLRNLTIFVVLLALTALFGAMMVLGAVHFNDCPTNHMALYTVVQGVFAMVNCAMVAVWWMWRCVSFKPIYSIWLLIFIFNLVWSIVGGVWIFGYGCPGSNLILYALGFSVPLWIVLILLCCRCLCAWLCCRNNEN